MKTSFYEPEELKELGLKSYGKNIKISRKASLYNPEEISLGNNIRIDDFCILSGKIDIGSYVHVAAYTALYAQYESLTIGDFAGLSSRVAIYTFSDDLIWGISLGNSTIPDEFKAKVDKGPVILEKHAMVGSGSVVLPKTEIKMGAVVGALSLVRGKVDAWKIYRGNPLKFVSKRPSKRILELEKELKKKYPF